MGEAAPQKVRGPAYRILEKQNHLMIDVRIQKKLDSSATSFAFQGLLPESGIRIFAAGPK
jgi:hypothetical protein